MEAADAEAALEPFASLGAGGRFARRSMKVGVDCTPYKPCPDCAEEPAP